ncbi:DUF960 family protein [Clostridium tertium]|uniref:DUF960 family protein n=1 Tax=Clostridium tertium TaxID=1559 RepID=UPI002A83968E|nr:DUF960 family protein [Clostridium tertium]MDY4606014.1 DUF960 family protein [Clostridium tertium]
MFKKDNRYVTRGVNEEVDVRLQLIMWSMIDKLKDEESVELDYLQVFKLRREGNKIVINQSQEVPEYSCTYEIELEDVQLDDEIKVYVIDSGEYSTMIFPSEY